MERIVKQVPLVAVTLPKKKRTAAYARVSCGKDTMLQSMSAQISYYSSLIQSNPEWEYCGVYADEAISGTKDTRPNFQKLLDECRKGNIDRIITKSISRFARNTVILLQAVRELKDIGVDVFFEEQNIHTMSAEGELMLTILASYAQEESRSVSENMKWRIRAKFESGMPWSGKCLGYRMKKGELYIVPEEAETVKEIFALYLSGLGCEAIAKILNASGKTTVTGGIWRHGKVAIVLENYNYTGNLLLQKTFKPNHLSKYSVRNRGELPQYMVQNTHEPIISLETYEAVQIERAKRAARFAKPQPKKKDYPFTSRIRCPYCGRNYSRKVTTTGPVWICSTYNTAGKASCPKAKQIPEPTLLQIVTELFGLPEFEREAFHKRVVGIEAHSENRLVFHMTDGTEITKTWKDRSRSESWTAEKREVAKQNRMKRGTKQ